MRETLIPVRQSWVASGRKDWKIWHGMCHWTQQQDNLAAIDHERGPLLPAVQMVVT